MASERNQFVDVMRGIAMLLVVLGHTMTGSTVGSQDSFLFNIVWSLQMPLFFLISGYVTRYSRGIDSGVDLLKYIKRRTLAYMLPWFVWSFVVRGIILGMHDFLNIKWLLWNMDSGYWFLVTIWTICMVYGVSIFIAGTLAKSPGVKQRSITLVFYVIGMAGLAGIGLLMGLSFFAIKLTLYYMPFYFAGYLYGQYRDKIFETKWGATVIDVIVVVCLAFWLFIMTRYHLYALPDTGIAIILRVASSITGCIAVCGLCKGLFFNNGVANCKDDTSQLVWEVQPKDMFQPSPAAQSARKCRNSNDSKYSGNNLDDCKIIANNINEVAYSENVKHKHRIEAKPVWKQRIVNGLLWAGKYSLGIYMVHGLVLNVLMPETKPIFPSIRGYCLIFVNFIITVLLCVVIINLIAQSRTLRKILGMR